MKISASIYSNPNKTMGEIVSALDQIHVEYFHVDCIEKDDVFDDIKEVRTLSSTPIDLHIITKDPKRFIDRIKEVPVELLSVQIENIETDFSFPKNTGVKFGAAILNDTPLEVLKKYEDDINFIMLMTTTPGKSGGTFDERTYQRVLDVRAMYPTKKIHVDGGVNDDVAKKLLDLNVDCAVSGSYLVKSDSMHVSLLRLRDDFKKLDFPVTEVLLKPNEVPIVKASDLTLGAILNLMNKSKMPFSIVLDDNKLLGVITDGDLRRSMLENLSDLNKINVNEILNRNPISVLSNSSVSQACIYLNDLNRKISFLPVVDSEREFLGVISILELLKGRR